MAEESSWLGLTVVEFVRSEHPSCGMCCDAGNRRVLVGVRTRAMEARVQDAVAGDGNFESLSVSLILMEK